MRDTIDATATTLTVKSTPPARKRHSDLSDATPHEALLAYLLALRERRVEVRADGERLRVSAPPGLLSRDVVEALRARKEELLAFLSTEARYVPPERPRATRHAKLAPLAATQRRLWFMHRLQPDASMYNLPYAFRIEGALDVSAMRDSLSKLVQRHEALRMRVNDDADTPTVVIAQDVALEVPLVDLADAPDRLQTELEREAARPFELTCAPPFRAAIYRLGQSRHVVFFNVHHIACDGWSIELMMDELAKLYAARVRGVEAELPPLAGSFLDYARRELDADRQDRLAAELERLRGIEPLELPTDHARPAVLSHRGAACWFTLDGALSAAVKRTARALDTTPYIVLLAAYKLLLSRYSGQTDVVVGSPVAGRDTTEDESLVGFFARTLVLRTDLGGSPSFGELVGRVREACFAAFQGEHVPFEALVDALNPARDRSRTPVFQALFSLQETSPRLDPVTQLPWQRLPLDAGGAKTDLTLLVEHDGERFSAQLEYSTDLFERATIERMVRNFQCLLEALVQRPDAPAARAPLVHAEELALLSRANQTGAQLPSVGGFYELFRREAERDPRRIAVVDAEGALTYGELDRRSDAWAARLGALGVGRGSRVGVAVGRSRRVLELNLGVMKAGAAYVPLDAASPADRLAFMADDAALHGIVCERQLRERLPADRVPVWTVEELERTPAPNGWQRVRNQPDDVAYIIYTSGSTGRPKGVEVLHRGVVNLLTSMARVPGCTEHDRVLAVSTFSFDMCIAELYLPLSVGARTILAPRTCAADGATLRGFIERYGATLVQATPTTFRLLVEAGLPRQRFKALGGGEPFPAQLARDLRPCCDEVWNGYGPTETTVYATFHRIDPERPVLIGRPLANTQLHVLDALQQPVPLGVTGELYIGGAGVSGGYRNRDELTRERFVPDPFSAAPGARLYRTGDLVRMHADGVQYVGRSDNQVKLRGYRIELGEIENALSAHEHVDRAVVQVQQLAEHDRRLVAYVVPRAGSRLDGHELRAHLGKQLPSYMVPRLFVPLESLPLTPSGKIDRARLPDPREAASDEPGAGVLPESATERALYEIWRRVLGTSELRVDDDFFDAGGHSLLAVQLIREINRTLHTQLSLGVVFDAPTIAAQADMINRGEHGGGVSIVPLRSGGTKEPLFCICGINLYQELASALDADRPVYGLFLPVEGELFEDSQLQLDPHEMARQYLAAIRGVQPHGPYHLTGVSFGGALAYEIAQQLRDQGEQVALLALLDTILPSALDHASVRRLARGAVRWARAHSRWVARALDAAPRRVQRALHAPHLPEVDVSPVQVHDGEAALQHRMRRYHQALARLEASMGRYDGDVLLVRARDQVRQLPGCPRDYGWRRHVRGSLHVRDLPGDHLGLLTAPNVEALAELLARASADVHGHALSEAS